MKRELIAVIKGIACLSLMLFFSLVALPLVLVLALLKWLIPGEANKRRCTRSVIAIAEMYIGACKGGYSLIHRPHWDISGLQGLSKEKSYMIICNHQSWTDIPVLVFLLIGRVPFFKFFLKKQLIWLPLIGVACWAMDYPFMRRYTQEQMGNNPQLRGQDLSTTQRLCEKLKGEPVSIVNYLEGTRFTEQKHQRQNSPYRHLLKPKSGGVAYVLSVLGDHIDFLLDVTIVYPNGRQGFWQFLSGRVDHIMVKIKQRPIPESLKGGDYQASEAFRAEFQRWIAEIWQDKDVLIQTCLAPSSHITR